MVHAVFPALGPGRHIQQLLHWQCPRFSFRMLQPWGLPPHWPGDRLDYCQWSVTIFARGKACLCSSLACLKAPTLRPDVQLPYPTTLPPLRCLLSDLLHSCILNMQQGITKQTQINSSWMDITTSCVPVGYCKAWKWWMTKWNAWKNKAHIIFRPPTHRADSLGHRQLERPFSWHTTNQRIQWLRHPPTSTTSTWLRKRPTQLNTPNIFVPDLVWVFPNTSDIQRLGRCVPAFRADDCSAGLLCGSWNYFRRSSIFNTTM